MSLNDLRSWMLRRFDTMSTGGLILGAVFFALSLTPSLLPRDDIVQGILSGCCFAAGYGIGASLQWLWNYLELKLPNDRIARSIRASVLALSILLAILCLLQASAWQNSIREAMHMPPVQSGRWILVAVIAVIPASILIFVGWLLVRWINAGARRLNGIVPRRVAFVASLLLVGVITTLAVNGVIVRSALRAADAFYAQLDALAGQYEEQPADALRSGSPNSLVAWDTIGRDARGYVESGPSANEIAAMIGRPAITPLRVYVGLKSAKTVEARAKLALDELIRVGAFSRSVLVLTMPVGTGWVDPVGIDTLEFLHAGDVASVALQYSYLTSWVSLVAEPDVGVEAAQALFSTIYDYWTTLPHDARPRLYLYGLSLGAYASQESVQLYDVLDDPFQGALWVGPAFPSRAWRMAVNDRQSGSPAWLPRVGNNSTVRFANQNSSLADLASKWGPVRIVYLQYGSDPVVFFEPSAWYRQPAWLEGKRADDVSPGLTWFPIVTFLQLSLDLTLAQSTPAGYGHVYAPQDYIDAWAAVTAPEGWNEEALSALKVKLHRSGPLQDVLEGWFQRSLPAG